MISCDESDYLEIACLYRIPIALSWADGRRLEGKAIDTGYNDRREECLLMNVGGSEECVALTGLRAMSALIENPHFSTIVFGLEDGEASSGANEHCASTITAPTMPSAE